MIEERKVNKTFGQIIRQARKDKGFSQRELAKQIGVNYTYLSKLENDHAGTPPSEDVIHKLALHLHLNAKELIYLAGRMTEDDARYFEEFLKYNYQQMPALFRKIRENTKNPNLVNQWLEEDEKPTTEE